DVRRRWVRALFWLDHSRIITLASFSDRPCLCISSGLLAPPPKSLFVRQWYEIGAGLAADSAEAFLFLPDLFIRPTLTQAFPGEVRNALPPDPPQGIVDQHPDDPVGRVK